MKKKIYICFYVVFALVFIAIIAISVFSIISINNNKLPFVFGHASVQILTNSMSPLYKAGDVITVKKCDADELAVGDIICFISSDPDIYGSFNTHRIAEIKRDAGGELCFITKGDNNPEVDKYSVLKQDILGLATSKNTLFSRIISILQNRFSFFIIVVFPMLFVLAISIRQFVSAVKQYALSLKSEVGEIDSVSGKKE